MECEGGCGLGVLGGRDGDGGWWPGRGGGSERASAAAGVGKQHTAREQK